MSLLATIENREVRERMISSVLEGFSVAILEREVEVEGEVYAPPEEPKAVSTVVAPREVVIWKNPNTQMKREVPKSNLVIDVPATVVIELPGPALPKLPATVGVESKEAAARKAARERAMAERARTDEIALATMPEWLIKLVTIAVRNKGELFPSD